MNKFNIILLILFISLLGNALMAYSYIYKIEPKLNTLTAQVQNGEGSVIPDCIGIFVDEDGQPGGRKRCLSRKEFEDRETQTLSECALKINEGLADESAFRPLRTVEEAEKLRGFLMKTCMESKGYVYKN